MITMIFPVLLTAAAFVAAGCGGDSESRTSTESRETTTDVASLPDPIRLKGAPSVPIAQRLIREIHIGGGADWMAYGFGSLWVKRDHAPSARVDPKTGRILADIRTLPFKEPVCQGIGVSDDA